MYKLEIKPLAVGGPGTGSDATKPLPRMFEPVN